ncbi:hypothetical protein LJR118_002858 [Acidovorax sp. LjRoot118]|uniref:hypothetical protein n=1 Tax=unclassified Acidovorax TaxID=2684926 RepID=UPI00070C3334|nr:hypothetical protein [Acidovorax sp. Root219]KRC20180.1 hypothetical protein ASE28_28225 [Acidovorax sp. Root219]
MNVTVDFWNLVGLLTAFLAAVAGAGKLLLDQSQRHLDERFVTQEKARAEQAAQLSSRLDGLEQVNREETVQWQRVEREMLKLVADMPMKYVMRDDYIRGQSIIEAKLDGLAGKLENAQLRGIINQGTMK